jgi:hypothetical protein
MHNHHEAIVRGRHFDGKQLRGYANIDGVEIYVSYSRAVGWFFVDRNHEFHFIDQEIRKLEAVR